MKKELLVILCIGMMFAAPACSVKRRATEKIRDLDFSVVREEEVPQELLEKIEEKEREAFRFTYLDQGVLFIAKGYGEKETSGYTVKVTACYEMPEAIAIRTELLGPPKEEKVRKERMNPHVVIRLNDIGKNVIFE